MSLKKIFLLRQYLFGALLPSFCLLLLLACDNSFNSGVGRNVKGNYQKLYDDLLKIHRHCDKNDLLCKIVDSTCLGFVPAEFGSPVGLPLSKKNCTKSSYFHDAMRWPIFKITWTQNDTPTAYRQYDIPTNDPLGLCPVTLPDGKPGSYGGSAFQFEKSYADRSQLHLEVLNNNTTNYVRKISCVDKPECFVKADPVNPNAYSYAKVTLPSSVKIDDLVNAEKSLAICYTNPSVGHWQPAIGTKWQIQFVGVSNPFSKINGVKIYDVDGFNTSAQTIADLHQSGASVICYISGGTWEPGRPDSNLFAESLKGNPVVGYPDEKWLDIRKVEDLMKIMVPRLKILRDKGCDAVDADNMDGYSNNSKFPLSFQDQINYNLRMATEAHTLALGIGLKNDLGQIPNLVDYYDFAINESCFDNKECNLLDPFIAKKKPVFAIQYPINNSTEAAKANCAVANSKSFDMIIKKKELDAYVEYCRSY